MQVRSILSFSLNILCLFGIYDCKKIYRNYSEKFYNLAVTPGHVYIGGNHSLIQLNSTLHEVKVIFPLKGRNWLLTPFYNKENGETIIISCTPMYRIDKIDYKIHCNGLTTNALAPVDGFTKSIISVKKLSVKYVTTVIDTKQKVNTLTIASSGCLQNGDDKNECLAISNYQHKLDPFNTHSVRYLAGDNGKLALKGVVLDFKNVVVHGHFTYFLFQLNNTKSKLGKMCTENLTSAGNDNQNKNTYEDLPIYCTRDGVNYTIAEDMVFWNNYLLVTFNDGVRSVVCKFTNIFGSFKTSRLDKLKCPKTGTKNQYAENTVENFENACYDETTGKCKNINDIVFPCEDVKEDFCIPQFFGSIEGNTPMEGDAIYHTQNWGTIIKMTDVLLAVKFAVLYVGTNKGFIGTIFINESAHAVSLGDFRLVQSNLPVIDIKTDGENVYVMTQNKVVNVANTEDCTGNSCEDCMKSKNLRCGWDIVNKRCNKEFNESFWVPSAGKACLRIVADNIVVKQDVSGTKKDSVNMKFKLEPAIQLESLKYNVSKRNSGELQIADDGYYHIPNIEVMSIDPIDLDITDMDGSLIVSTKVNLYQCGNAGSCTFCVKGRDCFWCPLTFQCVKNGSKCGVKKIQKQEEGNCPRVDGTKKVMLAKGKTEDVEVSAFNLEVFGNQNIRCLVGDKSYTANASNSSTVVCRNVKAPNKPSSDLKLQYNHQDLDKSAELEVYDCKDFGKPDGNCGNCRYQFSLGYKCQWCGSCKHINDNGGCSTKNCEISVNKISPPTGPENGGTKIRIYGRNIGNPNDNITVELFGVRCTDIKVLKPSTQLQCTTGSFSAAPRKNMVLVLSVNTESKSVPANQFYKYQEQSSIQLLGFSPDTSIIAGGKRILIKGRNIGFDDGHTFNVSFCKNGNDCINCRDVKIRGKNNLMCRIDKSDTTRELTKLKVIIDSKTELNVSQKFRFVGNPNIIKLNPGEAAVFRSGGAFIKFKGSGFMDVGEVRVDNVESPCIIQSDTRVRCKTPQFVTSDFERRKRSTGQNININFDNYQVQSTIYYVDDPMIYLLTENTPNILEYEEKKAIVITGNHLLEGASEDDYNIHIGLDGRCYLEDINNDNITCLPPKDVPRTNHSDKNTVYVMVVVGRIRVTVGHLKYISPSTPFPIYIIIITVLATALLLAVVIGILTAVIQKKRKKKAEENFQMELLSREENIRQASREEFADAQMTIRDIKSDLVTSRVPFFDYQTYAFHQLFPNEEMETHPILHEPMITDDNRSKVKRAMGMLDKLMNNKLFLKELVQTLDHHNKLSMKDKAHFASLLSVALIGNMRLFYELVSCLLNEMVQSASKRQYKVLFRRVESVTQRLMVNWLELILFDHLKNQSGMQLFMLYKATQIVIEKGPIDAVTQNSRNTLAEERLLKSRVEYETLTLNVDLNGNTDQRFPISVLNCDTITQVKKKAIIAIYKNKPASEVPTPDELELEWHQGRGGKLLLQDVDNISDRNNGMLRLNTLKHYMVKDESEMALMYKETTDEDPNEIYVNNNAVGEDEDIDENQQVQHALLANPDHIKLQMEDSTGDQGMHRWHLSNLTDEEKSDKEHEIGELFLNRLFQTKLLLRDYIDAAFEGVMDAQCLSIPVRYFLCMIDKLGKEVGLDSDVLQSWKSECYATRVWASLISKPQILFDVNVPSHVEPCMDILRQVFIDSFTQGTQNVSKDSSTQKLLFYKDVPDLRKRVNSFFMRVEAVKDQEFWRAIEDISNVQTREIKFSRQATLHQLYSFIAKYKNEIIEDFAEKDEAQNLEFGKKLEEIIDLMEETTEPRYLKS